MERKPAKTRDGADDRGTDAPDREGGRGGLDPGLSREAEFSAFAVRFLDAAVGPSHHQFAELVEISPSRASRYRHGRAVPRRRTMQGFADRVRLPLEWVEATISDALVLRGRQAAPSGDESVSARAEALARRLVGQLAPRFAALHGGPPTAEPRPPVLERAAEERAEAAERWAEIEPLTAAERSLAVLEISSLHTWALVERLCDESAKPATAPAEARALARLAVKLSRRVPTSPGFRNRLTGYALLHLAQALEAANDLPRAREARARGMRLFTAGRPEDPGLLGERVAGNFSPFHGQKGESQTLKQGYGTG